MSIPISALQRNAAAVVRKIAASNIAEEITDRGHVVAVLCPPPQVTGIERLRQAGLTRPAVPGALAEAIASLDVLPSVDLSGALAEQRDDDR